MSHLKTITANRKWHYLMNPQYSSPGGSVDKPCFTLIARMDKMPTSINASVVRANAALQNALTKTAVQRLDKSAKAPL